MAVVALTPEPETEKTSFVYVMKMGNEDVFKIGKAGDVEARREQFLTGNPHPPIIVDWIETDDPSALEKHLHGLYLSRRLRREFFELTPDEADEAGRVGRVFVANFLPQEREVKRLAKLDSDGVKRAPDERDQERHRQLLAAREAKYRAEIACLWVENETKLSIGTGDGVDGLFSWKTCLVPDFDEAAFRVAYPELYDEHVRATRQRRFRLL
jgi:hypothetical protein